VPGSQTPSDDAAAVGRIVQELGLPVMLKAAAGGGGKGMRAVSRLEGLVDEIDAAMREAKNSFGDGGLIVEKLVERGRHIEVQIAGDGKGNIVHLFERECSLQRRHQKLIEEAPAAGIPPVRRKEIVDAAVAFGESLGYDDVGTVEFLYDLDRDSFFFLEMNTRVQVEHPVTEVVTGADIVATQLAVAAGAALPAFDPQPRGHAIECRITAESVANGFLPVPGHIDEWVAPQGDGVRVDTHCFPGADVPPYYDSLLAKLVVHGVDRDDAADRMAAALDRFVVGGVPTSIELHRFVLDHPDYRADRVHTGWVEATAVHDFLEARNTL